MASKAIEREVARLRSEINRHNHLYYVEAASGDQRPRVRPADGAARRSSRPSIPSWSRPDSPTQRVGGQPLEGFATVRARRADALDRQHLHLRRGPRVGRPRPPRAEPGRAGALRRRAEGRRRGRLAPLRARPARPGRDPRRRRARRRHHGQPARPSARSRWSLQRLPRPAARGPRRGLHDQLRAGPAQRAAPGRRGDARSPTRATPPPARSSCSTRSSAASGGSGSSRTAWASTEGIDETSYFEMTRLMKGWGIPVSPHTACYDSIDEVIEHARALERPAEHARLPDRRPGRQGRRPRPARAAGRRGARARAGRSPSSTRPSRRSRRLVGHHASRSARRAS